MHKHQSTAHTISLFSLVLSACFCIYSQFLDISGIRTCSLTWLTQKQMFFLFSVLSSMFIRIFLIFSCIRTCSLTWFARTKIHSTHFSPCFPCLLLCNIRIFLDFPCMRTQHQSTAHTVFKAFYVLFLTFGLCRYQKTAKQSRLFVNEWRVLSSLPLGLPCDVYMLILCRARSDATNISTRYSRCSRDAYLLSYTRGIDSKIHRKYLW